MSVESQLADWQTQLEIQTRRKDQELAKARTHQTNAADAEQQILLLTGGITFAQGLSAEQAAQKDKVEEGQSSP